MKIMILVGSADADSHSLHLGQAIEDALQHEGAETELINLVSLGLPLYNRAIERQDAYDKKTRAFLDKSLTMDAFVWITPIYHNSYSSMLKNALDWHHSTKFPDKVVGLASNGGGRSTQAVDQLMLVARSQHMHAVRTRVCTDASDYDDNLNLTDQSMKERVQKFAKELVDLTKKLQLHE